MNEIVLGYSRSLTAEIGRLRERSRQTERAKQKESPSEGTLGTSFGHEGSMSKDCQLRLVDPLNATGAG